MVEPYGRNINALLTFTQQCQSTLTIEELNSTIERVVLQCGFRWFSLLFGHGGVTGNPPRMFLSNYPEEWLEEVVKYRLYVDDPAHLASARKPSGLSWKDISDQINISPQQARTLGRAKFYGLDTGFTIQVHLPAEPNAAFSASRSGSEVLTDFEEMTARLIGINACDCIHRLSRPIDRVRKSVSLTRRQIECVQLIAQGKSDWDISRILGLSPDTVHDYIESARKRYGVKKRIQLVLEAFKEGYLDARFSGLSL